LSCFALACSLSHLPNLCSAYQAENLYYGLTGERLEQLDKQHIDPLMSAMKARGITLAEIDKYLMARRAKERNEAVGRLHPATHDFHKAIAKAKSEGNTTVASQPRERRPMTRSRCSAPEGGSPT
jgi:hypothetical protein